MDEHLALLQGGSRHGETTVVSAEVNRLLAASTAPGLLDIYARTRRSGAAPGNSVAAVIFEFTGQEPVGDLAPEALHMPARR
ncbi:MAG: hypothetical protein ACYCO3_06960 [Mycobacteriales bacterium]